MEEYFAFPHFFTPVSGALGEVLDNETTTIDNIHLNGLRMTKVEFGGVSTVMKTLMEVAQYYTVLNYVPSKTTERR